MLKQDGTSKPDLYSRTIHLASGARRWRGALMTFVSNVPASQGVSSDLRWAFTINAARPPGALSLDMTANEGEAAPFLI